MKKPAFSKTFTLSPNELRTLRVKDPNTVYQKTLSLKPNEAFVIWGASLCDVNIPYMQAKQRGIKISTKSNYQMGDRKGLLVTRTA